LPTIPLAVLVREFGAQPITGGSAMGVPAGESGAALAEACAELRIPYEIPRETPTRLDEGRSGLLPV